MIDSLLLILNSSIRLATPIAYGTIAAVMQEKSGIDSLATEGLMLAGAFGAVLGSFLTGSAWLGLIFAMAAAMIPALMRGFLIITHQGNHVVSGIGMNIAMSGLTAMLIMLIWGIGGKSVPVTTLPVWKIEGIAQIPILGEILGQQNPLVYLFPVVFIFFCILINRTPFGLRITTCGENPHVLSSLGYSVNKYRYMASMIAACFAGLGGAYLSIGQLNFFSLDMTSGRGFMALAACMFGRWKPSGALIGAILFGVADAVQMRLQTSVGEYTQFIQMIPYVVTLIVLITVKKGKNFAPAAIGKPFHKQDV